MKTEGVSVMANKKKHPIEPPIALSGHYATAIYNQLLDHLVCHSCGKLIEKGDGWGAFGDILPTEDERGAEMQFIRLCREHWMVIGEAVGKLTRGWE